jgi:uncharacterized protein with NAD-binding domain and iron-sulfur cluster
MNCEKVGKKKIKVVILGAGIGGLTVAHELIKNKEKYQVEIFERNSEIGGLARSSRDKDGCATEYSWRVFFGFYKNLFKIFSEIPLAAPATASANNGCNNVTASKGKNNGNNFSTAPSPQPGIITNTVLDNLTPHSSVMVSSSKLMTLKDILISGKVIANGFTSCDQRLDKMDNISWYDSLKGTREFNALREVGPWFGLDRKKSSEKATLFGIEQTALATFVDGKKNYVTDQPTSEAIFGHWHQWLVSQGVKIHLNSEVVQIVKDQGMGDCQAQRGSEKVVGAKVTNIDKNHVDSGTGGRSQWIEADYFVLALPIEVLSTLAVKNNLFSDIDTYKLNWLAENCLHIQATFQVYFDRPISFSSPSLIKEDKKHNSVLLTDSAWDIILESYDQAYDLEKTKLCYEKVDGKVARGGWSVAVCNAYRKGRLIKKIFQHCTFSEMQQEIWNQIMSCTKLQKLIEKYNNFTLDRSMIVHWSPLWSDFYITTVPDANGMNGEEIKSQLHMREPKFTNNVGSGEMRPSFITSIPNTFIATAFIKETLDIFSMEGASCAGVRVANAIKNQSSSLDNSFNSTFTKVEELERPSLLAPLRKIDQLFYNHGLGNPVPIMLMIILVLILLGLVFLGFLFVKKVVKISTKK